MTTDQARKKSATEDNEVVVYRRGTSAAAVDDENCELWDDTELIKAYNKAVGLAYNAVSDTLVEAGEDAAESSVAVNRKLKSHADTEPKKKSRKQRTKKGKAKQWNPGDLCMAPYSVDGEMYEARVKLLKKGEMCIVEFLGYGDRELVPLSSLLSTAGAHSASGDTSVTDEVLDEETVVHLSDWSRQETLPQCDSKLPHSQLPVLPPPPPPNWLASLCKPPSDQEALSSMLMSWYMSGYHTGYYQALRELRGHIQTGSSGQKGVQSNRRKEDSY